MPKNTVTDPITDQEMVFAHLLMSGTMNDRRAAELAGLNPETAAYTKAKPRVRAYMTEHRAAVREKLVDQEAEGVRKLNISRDQILDRLWELATLSHEVTRGTIAGQIKALSMIIAIEGLIPSGMNARHLPPSAAQPADPPPAAARACPGAPWGSRAGAYSRASPQTSHRHVVSQPVSQPTQRSQSLHPPRKADLGARRNRLRLRYRSGRTHLPQPVLSPNETLLAAASLNSIKSQILSNFTNYPAAGRIRNGRRQGKVQGYQLG